MFHLINNLNLPIYVTLLLAAIVLGCFSLIKYRKTKAPWKAVVCICIIESIILILNRILEEYKADTMLHQVSVICSFVVGAILILSIFIGAYITQRKNR